MEATGRQPSRQPLRDWHAGCDAPGGKRPLGVPPKTPPPTFVGGSWGRETDRATNGRFLLLTPPGIADIPDSQHPRRLRPVTTSVKESHYGQYQTH